MVDLDALTTGDIAQIEDLSGQSITALSDRESPKGLALAAIAMVIARRNGKPDFTWEQALALKVMETKTTPPPPPAAPTRPLTFLPPPPPEKTPGEKNTLYRPKHPSPAETVSPSQGWL